LDSDGPRALTASSGFAPWSRVVAAMEKNPTAQGVKGGLPPWAASPLWGREGVTFAILTAISKNSMGFLQSPKNSKENFLPRRASERP
jgi:hypothetical protein